MRQWELVGITDHDPEWFPSREGDREENRVRWTFFWSTDTDLRFRTVSDAAAAALGQPAWRCEGQDLLATFGIEGANLAVLEAHTEALEGGEATFSLEGDGRRIRCRVEPTHAADGCVIGTFCLATDEDADDDPFDPARRRLATAAA